MMSKNGKVYEPPKAKVYQFDDNDQILTSSNTAQGPDPTTPTPEYAANALNQLFGGTNTTIE